MSYVILHPSESGETSVLINMLLLLTPGVMPVGDLTPGTESINEFQYLPVNPQEPVTGMFLTQMPR